MKYLPFESRDELYKKPFGAVADKEEVTLRLLLHDDARCTERLCGTEGTAKPQKPRQCCLPAVTTSTSDGTRSG